MTRGLLCRLSTVFWEPVVACAGKATCEETAARISGRYREFVGLLEEV